MIFEGKIDHSNTLKYNESIVIMIGETLVIIQVYRAMVHVEEEHGLMAGLHKGGSIPHLSRRFRRNPNPWM
jgi:hypothetical protein